MRPIAISGLDAERKMTYVGWALVLGLTAFIFWGTLRAPERKR